MWESISHTTYCFRIKLISNEAVPELPEYTKHPRTFPESYNQFKRSYDYDYHRGGLSTPLSAVQSLHDAAEMPAAKTIAVHQPREDPRLFYQSDSYIKEINRKNMNREVTSIYPGREVVRAGESYAPRSLAMRWEDRRSNRVNAGSYPEHNHALQNRLHTRWRLTCLYFYYRLQQFVYKMSSRQNPDR